MWFRCVVLLYCWFCCLVWICLLILLVGVFSVSVVVIIILGMCGF